MKDIVSLRQSNKEYYDEIYGGIKSTKDLSSKRNMLNNGKKKYLKKDRKAARLGMEFQGKDGEILKVVSVNDPTVYTYVFIGDARFVVTLNVPGEYSTIQSALSAAGNGDTVLVQPGTYTENIIWPETNGIKLISAGDSSNTIIDGGERVVLSI